VKSNYHLIPVYGEGDTLLVIHELDFQEEEMVEDGLIVAISLKHKEYKPAVSGQRYLKFCPCEPIPFDERPYWIHRMESQVPTSVLREIEEALLYPSVKAVKTLCWVPERLKPCIDLRIPEALIWRMKRKVSLN
jgi:hypothetical protein